MMTWWFEEKGWPGHKLSRASSAGCHQSLGADRVDDRRLTGTPVPVQSVDGGPSGQTRPARSRSCCAYGRAGRSLFPRLQRSHNVWRFSRMVSPPALHATTWSTWSSTSGFLAGLAPHERQVKWSRCITRNRRRRDGSLGVRFAGDELAAAASAASSTLAKTTNAARAVLHDPNRREYGDCDTRDGGSASSRRRGCRP